MPQKDTCAICMDDAKFFAARIPNRHRRRVDPKKCSQQGEMLKCGHIFHQVCISKWFVCEQKNDQCPMCRQEIEFSGCNLMTSYRMNMKRLQMDEKRWDSISNDYEETSSSDTEPNELDDVSTISNDSEETDLEEWIQEMDEVFGNIENDEIENQLDYEYLDITYWEDVRPKEMFKVAINFDPSEFTKYGKKRHIRNKTKHIKNIHTQKIPKKQKYSGKINFPMRRR